LKEQVPIITEPGPASQSTLLPDEISGEISEWYHQKGSEIVADAVALFNEEGIPVDQKLVEHADPAEAILKEAKDGNYDLIVIGHSGEEEQEFHLGSVAEKVSRHAQTPVLIARQKRRISKMLVPVDGSESSEKALSYAVLLAKRIDAEMTLLYVQESGLFKLRPEVAKAIGARILSKAVSQAKGVKIVQKLESGDPAKIVIQTAKNGNYDLTVMGSKGHSGLGRFLLGSASDHVIHYTDRSVLLTK
jgi:nucleotide-binding universal stress UspA family protein